MKYIFDNQTLHFIREILKAEASPGNLEQAKRIARSIVEKDGRSKRMWKIYYIILIVGFFLALLI